MSVASRGAFGVNDLGIAVAMLDILDCGDPKRVAKRRRLYTGYGFEPLPPTTVRRLIAEPAHPS